VSDPAYDRAWIVFRRRVRFMRIAERLWLAPFAFLVPALIVMTLRDPDRGSLVVGTVFFVLTACVVVVRIIADVRLKTFMCPRCRYPFVRLSVLQRAPLSEIDRRFPCQRCRLPMYAVSGS